MKKALLILCFLPALAMAQTTHDVEAFGGGIGNPDPQFSPQFITIMLGDSVHWENTQGKHNIYGMWDEYPNNPVEFTNGQPEFAPWDFTFGFTVPGFYEYQCNAFDHALTQFGSITVVDPNNVNEIEIDPVSYQIFPNPASDYVNVHFEGRDMDHIDVIDTNGKLVKTYANVNGIQHTFDVSDMVTGRYLMTVYTKDGRKYTGPLLIK